MPADQLQMDPLVERQWQLESMQLVNFGSFDGYHKLEFKTGFAQVPTTVISGDSGTGKSTIEDAFFEVMTRNGSYNSASNEGGRGGSLTSEKRSLIGYVRGKLEDVEDEEGRRQVQMLRDGHCNRWSAIVLGYRSDVKTTFSVAKLFWIAAGYTANSDIKQLRMTMFRDFDPRSLESIADANFTAERVRRVIGSDFRSFSQVDEFLTYVHRVLKVDEQGSGKEVMDLLGRIRSGSSFRSIDELFREQVLDRPATFEAASAAVASYREHHSAYERMREKQEKVSLLTEVREFSHERDEALEALDTGRAALAPALFDTWRRRVTLDLLKTRVGELTERKAQLERECEARRDERSRRDARLAELNAELAASGYTERLSQLDSMILRAQERLSSVRAASENLDREVTPHFGHLPTSEADFCALQERVSAFVEGYPQAHEECSAKHSSCVAQRVRLELQADELRSDLEYFQGHQSRIPRGLGEARERLAKASGIPAKSLPFVGELMEVVDEAWRLAIESVHGGLARTLLVDARDFERFSSSIDELRLRSRVTFRRVDVERSYDACAREGYLSEKLTFASDSPFGPWVRSVVCDEHHDALCVGSPRELGGEGRRVTINGQTRDGSRGAHGRDRSSEGIIGFDNSAQVERLTAELVKVSEEHQAAKAAEDAASKALSELVVRQASAERIARYDFREVDVASAHDELVHAQHQKDEFVRSSGRLERLAAQVKDARLQLEEAIKSLGGSERELQLVCDELTGVLGQRDELVAIEGAGERIEGTPPAFELLGRLGGKMLANHSAQDNLKSLGPIVEQVRRQVMELISRDVERERGLRARIERRLQEYQERWPDNRLGTEASSAPDYLVVLSQLEEEGFHLQKDAWFEHMLAWVKEDLIPLDVAFRDARESIDDRLEPINDILRTLPFGREGGRLEIVCRDSEKAEVREFRLLMRELLDYEGHSDKAERDAYYRKAEQLIALIDPEDTRVEARRRRNDVLDRRRHVRLTARVIAPEHPDKPKAVYNMLASKSGGEVAEIVAFILGAALLYRLGQEGGSLPGFAPVLLDEGFIKADSRFTTRALSAWQGFGFQIIIAVPEEKFQSVVAKAQRVLHVVADPSRRSFVAQLDKVGPDLKERAG